MTTEMIDITPRFNEGNVQAYADEHFTRDPQTHVTARLEVLANLSDHVDGILEDPGQCGEKLDALVEEIQRQHRKASNDLLGFFAP